MFWTNVQGKDFRDKDTDPFSRDWKHASNDKERLVGESQVEIGKGGVLTPRNESNDYLHGTSCSPCPHLPICSFSSY